jgi:hypothetical protein
MHRCLYIPEISLLLCAELGGMRAKKSLAALARTCVALCEPALDVLWYELSDLLPLVKCMPSDLWRLEFWGYWEDLVRSFPPHLTVS